MPVSDRIYRLHFPLFDGVEGTSNEMRLTHEGLLAHPRVELVDDPAAADHLVFCQNHLVHHNPLHPEFRELKDQYEQRSIMLDYEDDAHYLHDGDTFSWALYFKRSCVDRATGEIVDHRPRVVHPTAYAVMDAMVVPPEGYDGSRSIDVSCLFEDGVIEAPLFRRVRGRLLTFAKQLEAAHDYRMQVGTVSPQGPVGRSSIDPRYKSCLFDSKIVLTANPDDWEGDSRTWEALAAGALVCIDRMRQPFPHPLVDGEHVIFYEATDEGFEALAEKIRYYLDHEDERERIGRRAREFVLAHHRSVNRVQAVIDQLDARRPDVVVTIATGHDRVDQFRRFISTLRRAGATCPVFVGISEGPQYEPVKRYLLEHAVNYFTVPSIEPGNKIVNGYRFEQYRQWLGRLDFRYALLMDFRDAFFQLDPFADIDRYMHDCDLYLMSEFVYLTVGNHPNQLNYSSVASAFGRDAADAIADEVVLNSDAILGTKPAIMEMLQRIARTTSEQHFAFADQGTLNHLAHSGQLDGCGRIKITRAGESLVNNCGFTEIDLLERRRPISDAEHEAISFIPRDERGRLALYRDELGWVLDDDGSISHVVHPHDRSTPEIVPWLQFLSRYTHPDEVFVDGTETYRSEKFVLFGDHPLEPQVLDRLIDRIKAVPVHRKPLLLLDRRFRHGFAFAYGTLVNDLRFETREMREAFGHPGVDPQISDRFCRVWDYEPIFLEEHEVFPNGAPNR